MKILLVHQGLEPYVARDLEILRSAHEVRTIQFTGLKGLGKKIIPDLLKLCKGVLWCDLTFNWFGKLHAMFSVLFSRIQGKKSIVVAGGDDVLKVTYGSHSYGILTHPLKKWFSYFSFKYADQILAVSNTSLKEVINNANSDPIKTTMIYHGFDANIIKKQTNFQKEKMVVTISRVTNETYIQKGLKLFVETAGLLPDIPFVLVGSFFDSSIEKLKAIATPNVTFTGWVDDGRLIGILSEASVYVQASIHEAFGCSIAEAMLCKCVPVVANLTAMPEVVGNAGYYIESLTVQELSKAIQIALNDKEMGLKARERIIRKFPLEKRSKKILNILEELSSP